MKPRRPPAPPRKGTAKEAPAARRSSPLFWVLLPLLVLALLGQTDRARDRLNAGRLLRQTEILTMAAIQRGQVPAGLFGANLQTLGRAAELDPLEIGIPIARGSQYLLLRNGSSAAAAYREALELEPRPEIYLNLGRAALASNDREQARRHFRTALRLDPRLLPYVPADLR